MSINYEETANKIKLLAHPERLRILDVVRREPECVCHLTSLLGKLQPYVSQQLSLLRKAGIIEDEKDGLNVYYRLADEKIAVWLDDILGEAIGEHSKISQHKKLIACPCPKCETETEMMTESVFAR
ncbi:MAG: hypothetical protein B6242_12775 [Anaerolineaceae bacterium 4572_78]|nr:MAG: hypothetical protein B6242_12775 [Anaerolineaceae bacterium 4572_78]